MSKFKNFLTETGDSLINKTADALTSETKDAFEDGQIRDNLKREYCIKNSINLIEIPYWDFNKINYEYIKEKIGQ